MHSCLELVNIGDRRSRPWGSCSTLCAVSDADTFCMSHAVIRVFIVSTVRQTRCLGNSCNLVMNYLVVFILASKQTPPNS